MPVLPALLTGALLGLVAGSYVAVLAFRWPVRRGTGGRSACDGCGARLRWWELVPLLSWIALRGRCVRCGGRIDPLHPTVEAAGAAIGASALAAAPDAGGVAGALFGWALLALAVLDARHFWLPDRITWPLALAGLGLGLPPLADRTIGLATGWASLTLVAAGYRTLRGRTGLGQGDAKLFAAIGAWLGWAALPFVLLAAALAGLVWVAVLALAGRGVTGTTRLPLGTLLAGAAWGGWLLLR